MGLPMAQYFRAIAVLTVLLCMVAGCSDSRPPTGREKGAVIGGVGGAGVGAAVGNQLGSTAGGAAVGGVAGATTGALIGEAEDSYEGTVAAQEEVLNRQQEELDRQDREIEDLKRQQYHNEGIKPYNEERRR